MKFGSVRVAALLDTGSSINLMSHKLFNRIPSKLKSQINDLDKDSLILANNAKIDILGTSNIHMMVNGEKHTIFVYVLEQTSNPLLLGTQYLKDNKICLDFGNLSIGSKQANVRSINRITIQPNSETVIMGKLPENMLYGQQGICNNTKYLLSLGLLVSKSLVTVSYSKCVPLKILNPGNAPVVVKKGKILAHFTKIDKDDQIFCLPSEIKHQKVKTTNFVSPMSDSRTISSIQTAGSGANFPKYFNSAEITDSDSSEWENSADSNGGSSSSENKDANASEFLKLFNINFSLSEEQHHEIRHILLQDKDIFVTPDNPTLGHTDLVEHHIVLKPDFKPNYQRPYRLPPQKREILRHHLDELLQQGIITPLDPNEDAPISSPIVLVTKRNRKSETKSTDRASSLSQYRFCVDFRHLNSQSLNFSYFIPDLQELTESFTQRTPNYITSIDMSSGFFQMNIDKTSTKYTAFNTCFGSIKFLRLPMGLSSSPSTFQLLMDKVLKGLTFRNCLCYLDDVLIFSETFESHLTDLQEIFDRFRSAGLKLNPQKCSFAQQDCVYLGHHISKDGIRPPPDRVTAIKQYPTPKNVQQLRRALGLFNWFRKFMPNFSSEAEPLYKLLKRGVAFVWTNEQDDAFNKLKTLLVESEILAFPRFDLPFYLSVDTSSKGLGYMLYQKHPAKSELESEIKVVRFGSKSLNKWQKSYGPTKLELLGLVTSVVECSSYLRGNHFIVECDHQALKPLFQKKLKGAIYDRWLSILQQYNFDIKYKPASQMLVPDALSRCTETNVNDGNTSPDEMDPFFPYVTEHTGNINLPEGVKLQNVLGHTGFDSVNAVCKQKIFLD